MRYTRDYELMSRIKATVGVNYLA